ncbi:MAG TPA: HAD family phosphatase [Fimbriiglobus sp.]|jgi:HAD superfamily hydrolase (TIGR01509 family)
MTWSPPAGTSALIFDCDGTLADTMPIHFRAWTALLRPRGIPFPEDRFYALGGMPTARIIRLLTAECGVPVQDVDAMVWEKEKTFLDELHGVLPIVPVVRIAEQFRHQLPMAVASGGYRDVVGKTLDVIRVRDWFDAVVCAEDTPRHKPEPDVFLEAAKRLAVRAEGCVVFEDTDIGLEAARRAGMHTVDVRPWRV